MPEENKNQQKPKIETSATISEASEKSGGIVWEVVKTVGGILLFLIIFRFYIFQPFSIKGSSMEPDFHDGEYMIVNELSYHFTSPKRGDVVIFKHPEPVCTEFIETNYFNRIFFQGPCSNYIKRVIGLPGETITIKDGKVFIKNDENSSGFELPEPYLPSNMQTMGNQTRELKNDEYYVLGDNRAPNASSDSREWGPLPRNHIVGKGFIILLPFDQFGTVKSPDYNK